MDCKAFRKPAVEGLAGGIGSSQAVDAGHRKIIGCATLAMKLQQMYSQMLKAKACAVHGRPVLWALNALTSEIHPTVRLLAT